MLYVLYCIATIHHSSQNWSRVRYSNILLQVSVAVGSNGIATQDNAEFFYIDKWSSQWTWGGHSPPVEGDFVVIQQVNFGINIK